MIPLKDSIPNVHRPWTVYVLLGCNSLTFLFELLLHPKARMHFIQLFGVIPERYFGGQASWTGDPLLDAVPFLAYMFLHSGWMHFLLNMWVLWIFADNVEDVMGHGRFAAFYVACGLLAVFGHMLLNTQSQVPVIGASGAIAGVMGAYFLLYPHGRVLTLIPIFFFPYIVELPAVLFLGLWFVLQFLSGMAQGAGGSGAGVAFWAHAVGFVAGMLLLPLFRRRERCYYCYNKDRKRYEREAS
ncbi:rhomboid family intramembrane serine protease [Desulfohalovibrio reitneri]|uniref:rhomboid family intramembrane serine protease n=1 Tax=Desulfohalovibrio reitneri TaxID=1307759 RepID=UPI0004A70D3E|nr:rhomboid family intramembrane serine protease [Desulfohalovibrio reitneri]